MWRLEVEPNPLLSFQPNCIRESKCGARLAKPPDVKQFRAFLCLLSAFERFSLWLRGGRLHAGAAGVFAAERRQLLPVLTALIARSTVVHFKALIGPVVVYLSSEPLGHYSGVAVHSSVIARCGLECIHIHTAITGNLARVKVLRVQRAVGNNECLICAQSCSVGNKQVVDSAGAQIDQDIIDGADACSNHAPAQAGCWILLVDETG